MLPFHWPIFFKLLKCTPCMFQIPLYSSHWVSTSSIQWGDKSNHMEVDLLYQESIVTSSNTRLFRLDLSEQVVYPMIHAHGRNMINISWYPSFAQMDDYKILLLDGTKHCLKLFRRVWMKSQCLLLVCAATEATVMDWYKQLSSIFYLHWWKTRAKRPSI